MPRMKFECKIWTKGACCFRYLWSKEYRLQDYNTWFLKEKHLQTCLVKADDYSNLSKRFKTLKQYELAKLFPIEAGGCRPPSDTKAPIKTVYFTRIENPSSATTAIHLSGTEEYKVLTDQFHHISAAFLELKKGLNIAWKCLQNLFVADKLKTGTWNDWYVKLMEESNMKPLDSNLAALSERCSKDLELNLANSFLSEMSQCTTAYPYNQLLGALVLKNYERQDATLLSWNLMYIVDYMQI
uniref:Uncharacterized protein n=1 Tax=Lactuca sativa TaxID=4236 RepID=A0A9R1UYA8_LACSA|nr:hypothetical protein LSAT_V11C700377970 [Lactuca sativa]